MLKTVVLPNIFMETVIHKTIFRIRRLIESSKYQNLYEIDIFSYIIHVFTLTFDQFNASLLNKIIKSLNFWMILSNGVLKNAHVNQKLVGFFMLLLFWMSL